MDRVVPGRAAALFQLESGSLQPDVGSARGDRIIEKASSEDRRGHSPQTPRGETPQGGKQHTGEPHAPTEPEGRVGRALCTGTGRWCRGRSGTPRSRCALAYTRFVLCIGFCARIHTIVCAHILCLGNKG